MQDDGDRHMQKRPLTGQSGESRLLPVVAADPAKTDAVAPPLSAPGPPHDVPTCELPTQLLVSMSTRFLRQRRVGLHGTN